ncbi:MAG: hypothetical protein WCP39_01175, partial [Chlamydiota bacterium]
YDEKNIQGKIQVYTSIEYVLTQYDNIIQKLSKYLLDGKKTDFPTQKEITAFESGLKTSLVAPKILEKIISDLQVITKARDKILSEDREVFSKALLSIVQRERNEKETNSSVVISPLRNDLDLKQPLLNPFLQAKSSSVPALSFGKKLLGKLFVRSHEKPTEKKMFLILAFIFLPISSLVWALAWFKTLISYIGYRNRLHQLSKLGVSSPAPVPVASSSGGSSSTPVAAPSNNTNSLSTPLLQKIPSPPPPQPAPVAEDSEFSAALL